MMRDCAGHPRRGIIVAELLFGLTLMAVVLTVLLLSAAQQRAGQKAMSERREATRVAERALLALRTGNALPAQSDAAVDVQELAEGATPPNGRWVQVTVRVGEQRASLVGLVAAEAAP